MQKHISDEETQVKEVVEINEEYEAATETVKEDMHITTDSPQEASMLMQILMI